MDNLYLLMVIALGVAIALEAGGLEVTIQLGEGHLRCDDQHLAKLVRIHVDEDRSSPRRPLHSPARPRPTQR